MSARNRASAKWFGVAAGAACALLAQGASASEGGLELLPDFLGKLPILIALFALMIAPANAILFKPIFRVLDERSERTAGATRRAEKIAKSTEETLVRYESAVRDVRSEAENARKQRASTARDESSRLAQTARADAERELERARGELAAALESSRRILRAQVQGLADEAAARVLGRPL